MYFIKLAFIICLFLVLLTVSPGRTIVIPNDYSTIQAGIDAAATGDTVLVNPGEYPECLDFTGKAISVGSLYLTTSDTSYINQTVISGCEARDFIISFTSNENSDALLAGFTITHAPGGMESTIGCHSSSPSIEHNYIRGNLCLRDGAAISCIEASPRIYANKIIGNHAGYWSGLGIGGGIYCNNGSNPIIESNIIRGNLALCGGGIVCSNGSEPIIRDNEIAFNHAEAGGAIYICYSSSPVIEGNFIAGNIADFSGGGILSKDADIQMTRNVIANNFAGRDGGGLYFFDASLVSINNTIAYNEASDSGGGMWLDGDSLVMVNNIVWGNEAYGCDNLRLLHCSLAVNYSDINGGMSGDGNIDSDPLFADSENYDYSLLEGSPCIDSGDPGIPLDPDGTRCDMGALYHEHTAAIDDDYHLPESYLLLRNYPNPFNNTTTIVFNLPKISNIKLAIYDLNGRVVEHLDPGVITAGTHRLNWQGNDQASGIYFIRLTGDDYHLNHRMILLK